MIKKIKLCFSFNSEPQRQPSCVITPVAIVALRSSEVLQTRLPRPLVETGPCNHLASFGKPEKSNKNSLTTKTLRLKNMLMAKVCSELARGFVQKSTNDKACSELVRLFGVCSELARSSFGVRSEFVRSLLGVCSEFIRSSFGVRSSLGVCSELVRSWFTRNLGPLRNAYPEKHVLLRIM